MIKPSRIKKGWSLLDARERRNAWIVLVIIIISAFASAVMIGSIMPFLSVLSDPERIRSVPALAWAYEWGGFSSDFSFLIALGAASFVVIVLANLVQVARVYAVTRYTHMRVHTLSTRLLTGYLGQPYEYFLQHHTGDMGTQILSECQQVVLQFFRPLAEVISSALTIFAVVALLIWVDPLVAIVTFALVGSVYGVTYALSRRVTRRLGTVRADTNQERFRVANEALGGVKAIKLLGREHAYVKRYIVPSQRMAQVQAHVGVISQVPQFVMQAVAFGGMILLCLVLLDTEGLASGAALGGLLPLLGVFAFAGQRLIPELSKLYVNLTQLNFGGAAVEAVHRDLVELGSGEPRPGKLTESILGFSEDLRMEHVEYRYPGAAQPALSDISLTVTAGERVGIVGSTGAGKTTLADIILGLLSPTSGRILVDGNEVDAVNVRQWQNTIGYVPQEIFLIDASVAENIALGLPTEQIDYEQVRRAAHIAQIDRFVTDSLPEGYATKVGERGVRLSGGQRQRIGIARALYYDAALIVFDEATSALDNLTEREVMKAIEALPGDKTVMMIAHRLSTVKVCDRIVVLDNGCVAGVGPWSELATRNTAFQALVDAA